MIGFIIYIFVVLALDVFFIRLSIFHAHYFDNIDKTLNCNQLVYNNEFYQDKHLHFSYDNDHISFQFDVR